MALSAAAAQQAGDSGEEECHICRDEIPATIAFMPCKHKVCFGCVENMRAKNIFKVRATQRRRRQQLRGARLAIRVRAF